MSYKHLSNIRGFPLKLPNNSQMTNGIFDWFALVRLPIVQAIIVIRALRGMAGIAHPTKPAKLV